jgi:polygalacturonase
MPGKQIIVISFLMSAAVALCQTRSIVDYGAVPDGKTLNTKAIQAAIDEAAAAGGGQVLVGAGTFLTGSIILKDNVELHLAEKGVLLGSLDFFDYRKTSRWYALILSKGAANIGITGKGTIDGQGRPLALNIDELIKTGKLEDPDYNTYRKRPNEKVRPQLIEFVDCHDVIVRDVTLKDAACWVQTYHQCRNVIIEGIRVESTAFWNNDGLDLSDCRDVIVRNCFINSADDGICLKSHDPKLRCDNITVENCTIRSSASAVKFGTASHGGFTNIVIKDITVYDTYRSAIALETVDGGTIENIAISNIKAKNTGNAVFLRIGQRNQKVPPGSLRNVHIRNMNVEVPNAVPDAGYPMAGPPVRVPHNLICSSIVGLPDRPVENVTLENIEIVFGGGARKETAYVPVESLDQIPQRRGDYPEFSMFGELPATGFFVRHAEGLVFRNIKIKVLESDFRPALVFDDVRKLQIEQVDLPSEPATQIVLRNTTQADMDNRALEQAVVLHPSVSYLKQ